MVSANKVASNGHGSSLSIINRMKSAITSYIENDTTLRADILRKLQGNKERKDVNGECGYPEDIDTDDYKQMYDREGIATRVVTIYPKESWKMPPDIYETESIRDVTPFEKAWKELNKKLRIVAKMQQLDKLAGIGRFGIMLLGFNDGGELSKSVRKGKNLELLWVRPLPEIYAKVKSLENNPKSPRYGQPVSYTIYVTGADRNQTIGVPVGADDLIGADVHWTRVIHFADNQESSEIFGVPRLQNSFNRCEDLRKILGADGEGFWKGGFPGLSLETHPNMEAIDFGDEEKQKTKDEIEKYMMGLQRYLATVGMTVKSITPQLSEPGNHFRTQVEAIAISVDCPMRIFMGSEEGKLASSQDMRGWNGRLSSRQTNIINPYIIEPFFDRMIEYGVLPKPKELIVKWPDLNAPTENDRAVTAQKISDALMKYVTGNVYLVIPPKEYLTVMLGYPIDQVNEIIKAAGGEKSLVAKITKALAPPPVASPKGSKVGGAKRKPKTTEGAGTA